MYVCITYVHVRTCQVCPQLPKVLVGFGHTGDSWNICLGLVHTVHNNTKILAWLTARFFAVIIVLLSFSPKVGNRCVVRTVCLCKYIFLYSGNVRTYLLNMYVCFTHSTCFRCFLYLVSSSVSVQRSPESFCLSLANKVHKSHLLNRHLCKQRTAL